MDELTLEGKNYLSSKRAAKVTGYAKDYIGQLAREGRVEARLVGRAWYVLESSIREHRFGAPAASKPEPELAAAAIEPEIPWPLATYKPEASEPIVPLAERPAMAPNPTPVVDMQSVWRDWFTKKQELLLESEYEDTKIEASESEKALKEEMLEEGEVPVALERILEEPKPIEIEEEVIPIHRSYGMYPLQDSTEERIRPVEPVVTFTASGANLGPRRARGSASERGEGTAGAFRALFICIAAFALLIFVLGTDYFSAYTDRFTHDTSVQFAPLRFFSGETILIK